MYVILICVIEVGKREFFMPMDLSFHRLQQEIRVKNKSTTDVVNPSPPDNELGDEGPNIISENILKCLATILMRMSSVKNPGPAGDMPSSLALKTHNYIEGWDPNGSCLGFGKQDIGPYNQLGAIEVRSFNPKRTSNSLILLCRLKYGISNPNWTTNCSPTPMTCYLSHLECITC